MFHRRYASQDPVGAAGSWSGPAPGKRTLTADLPAQAKRGGAPRGGQLPSPSTGAPLPAAIAQAAGAEFGHDFSAVRVHHDGAAEQLGTQAFARGDDLHFASGAFQPDAQAGRALIGHELAHVAQQRDGRVEATGEACGTPVNTDAALEAEADRRGDAFADVVQGFDIDELLAMPAPRAARSAGAPVAQGADLSPEEDRDHDGEPDKVTVPIRPCVGVCRPKGPSEENHWGLPEPLLTRMGGDLPLVDVTTGTTTIKLATPFGSSSLGSDGKFKITIKDGDLTAGTDGTKVEVGGKVGPVSGAVDSTGKVSGAAQVGPFTFAADSGGKASFSAAGVKMEYDRNTGQIATTFTPELSWGPATFKGAAVPGGVKITLELKLALSKDWSITIAQEYIFKKTITDAEAQRAVIEAVVDPFFEAVNGGQGNFSDLLRALGGP